MPYAFFDGDSIGDTLEILLTENKVAEAKRFSESIKDALSEIEIQLRINPAIEIIICGGDDLLIKFDLSTNNEAFLQNIMNHFKSKTGHSMSCGVGEDISHSVRNLYLAKLYGKNQIKGLK